MISSDIVTRDWKPSQPCPMNKHKRWLPEYLLTMPEHEVFDQKARMEDEEGNPDNAPIREETLGPAFLHLKIVMDAFIGTEMHVATSAAWGQQ